MTYARARARAQSRALIRLSKLYPEEFARLLREERTAEGISPDADPSKWQTRAKVTGERVVAAYRKHHTISGTAAALGVSRELVRRRLHEEGVALKVGRPPHNQRALLQVDDDPNSQPSAAPTEDAE